MDFDEFLKKFTVIDHDKYLEMIKDGGVMVCMSESSGPSHFDDDLHGECAICKTPIYFRPYNKEATLKVCLNCGLEIAKEGLKESN